VLRINSRAFPIYDDETKKTALLQRVSHLKKGEILDINVHAFLRLGGSNTLLYGGLLRLS